jgi:hypothetical protein
VLVTWKRVIQKIEFGGNWFYQFKCAVEWKKKYKMKLFLFLYTHRRPWFLSGRLWRPAVHRQWWDGRPLRNCLLGRRMRFSFLSWYVRYNAEWHNVSFVVISNDSQVNWLHADAGILIATLATSVHSDIFLKWIIF